MQLDVGEWPKISIIIPSFNHGNYIEEAIRSILLQEYPQTELIVIDGGSTDFTPSILQKFNPWISFWCSEKDSGQSQAINKGLKLASGDLITFFGADDVYQPGAFWEVASKFNEFSEIGAIIGSFFYIDKLSKPTSDIIPPALKKTSPCDLTLGPTDVYRLHQVSTFFTRCALDSVGRYVREDYNFVMDRELLYRVCGSFQIVTDSRTYAAFRRHPDHKGSASILEFANEFAQLYRDSKNGNPNEDKLREHMAKHHLATGYLRLCKSTPSQMKRVSALLEALRIMPGLVSRYHFWSAARSLFKQSEDE